MESSHIILAILWIAYCVLHSVLASVAVKRFVRSRMKQNFRLYRVFYTLFAFLSLAALVYYQILMNTQLMFIPVGLIKISGIAIGAAGLILMLVCIRKYFFSLSGLRGLFIESATNELIITGVHKFMRHPLYLGTFAFIWGFFLVYPYLSLFISNAVITVYTLIGIRLEEQKLVAEFGDQYRQYRQSVPKLIPRLRSRRDFG